GGLLVAGSASITGNTGVFQCKFTHGPASPTVRVQVNDGDPSSNLSNVVTVAVAVANVAPTVSLSGPATADEGDTKTYNFGVTDPGQDKFVLVGGFPDCGTGGAFVAGSLTTTASGGSFNC